MYPFHTYFVVYALYILNHISCSTLWIYTSIPVSLRLSPVWLPRGLILQDLTFVHLGNPDMLMTSQGSKVNFSKRWQQFNILDTLRSYQQVSVSEATLSAIAAGQSVGVSTYCVISLSLSAVDTLCSQMMTSYPSSMISVITWQRKHCGNFLSGFAHEMPHDSLRAKQAKS